MSGVDFNAVCAALTAAADTVDGLTCYDYVPDSVSEPCFYPQDIAIEFNKTYGGDVEAFVTCMVLVARSDDKAGQRKLRAYLSHGAASIKAALEAAKGAPGEPALGGAADDLHVQRVTGYAVYTVGETPYYGAKLIVRVIGSGV